MVLFITMAVVFMYVIRPCDSTAGDCSPSTFGSMKGLKNKDGALQFPVINWKHPCLQKMDSSSIQLHPAAVNLPAGASPVVANDRIHKGKFFMVIRLGTPPVFNLVTIDTGSILSWVECQPCQIWCYTNNAEAGPTFDPRNSTTYQRVACSSQDCTGVQERLGVQFGCMEEMETCLYSFRYGSGPMAQYAVGRLSKDRLGLTLSDNVVVDDFIFGCSEDVRYQGREAGIVGFGNDRFSFLNQVMAQQPNSYRAFSYCFPAGDGHDARGFLSIGPYARDGLKFTNLVFGYGGDRRAFVYSLQQLDMMVDGRRLDVDPWVYTSQMMVIDSGTAHTFLLAPVFYALENAVTTAMAAKGYARHRLNNEEHTICFQITGSDTVDWSDLPKVEMKFTGTTLKLSPQNVFSQRFNYSDFIVVCMAFQPRDAGVYGVQILGNMATRSFRVVFDLQAKMFGFQPDAC